jgi:glycosyltransferase involved in cell wall biosynthesis
MDSILCRRIAFIGNYVPRRCGIATFTRDLCESVAFASPAADCLVGAVNDRIEGYDYPDRVRFEMVEKDIDSYRRAADFLNLNNVDILCVQHEFGIYGGAAGSHLLALLKQVRMPVVTTLHTVLREPNAQQRQVMDDLAKRSNRIVVMADKGAEFLKEIYKIPETKVDTIPHGIPDLPFSNPYLYKNQFGVEGRKVLLTFGLLGPAKGIEYVIGIIPMSSIWCLAQRIRTCWLPTVKVTVLVLSVWQRISASRSMLFFITSMYRPKTSENLSERQIYISHHT